MAKTKKGNPVPTEDVPIGKDVSDVLGDLDQPTTGETSVAKQAIVAALSESAGSVGAEPAPSGPAEPPTVASEAPKRRGRPPGSRNRTRTSDRPPRALGAPSTQPEPPPTTEEIAARIKPALAGSFRFVGRILGNMRGKHWTFTDDEINDLAEVWATPLAPYMADAGEYLAWITAAGATWAIVGPRLARDAEIREGRKPIEVSPGVEVGTKASDGGN